MLKDAERARFEELANWSAGCSQDFVLTEVPAPGGDDTGWVTILRRSTRIARTYAVGANQNWLERFRRDVDGGVLESR